MSRRNQKKDDQLQGLRVEVRNGKVDQALRKFKRKIVDSNKLFDYREKEYYEKPSQRRKKKKASAKVRERKRQEKPVSYTTLTLPTNKLV